MQSLAYHLDFDPAAETFTVPLRESFAHSAADGNICAACGEHLLGADADASLWQRWQIFSDALGMSNVELVCGACGDYLQKLFSANDR